LNQTQFFKSESNPSNRIKLKPIPAFLHYEWRCLGPGRPAGALGRCTSTARVRRSLLTNRCMLSALPSMGHLGTLWGAKEMTGLDGFGAAERARARPVAEARRGRQARAEECAAPLSSGLRASCSLVHLPALSRAWARVTDARGVPHCSWHADAHSLRLSTLAPRRGSPMRAILTCTAFHHPVAWPLSEWGRFPNRTPLRTAKRTAKLLPRAHGALAGRAGCGGGGARIEPYREQRDCRSRT
jgi:hypothetical protein